MTYNCAKAQSTFLTAIEMYSQEQWPVFLQSACGDDLGLRGRVEQLLQAHVDLGSIHGRACPTSVATLDPLITEKPGTEIGSYKLLEEIGAGGFGVVYVAEQQKPVCRKVALKIIKPGMDTRQVIARFEAERQTLALMDHPNIARMLDAGSTNSGRPYFVMDLIKGVAITEYCDKCSLSVRERLQLFVSVCRAVQHAHQKGIIHRDIKPTNVMIAMQDGQPAPKIIDFGVAKAMGQRLTADTLSTGFAQMLGTPLYMSPEQAELSRLDVDTRADIYSLGVLLYELLTGTTPFERSQFSTASYDEIRRIIREVEAPHPSRRISTLQADAVSTVADHRRADPRKLSHQVRGDLDWIVMKAMEKDRTRRYETVGDLASDVEHHLNGLPVVACPPSATYRFRKFAHRNKVGLMSAAAILAALLLGTVVSTWQAIRATRALEAGAVARLETDHQRQRAEANLDKARHVVDGMLTRVAGELDEQPQMKELQRELLEEALAMYQGFLQENSSDPEVRRETAKAYRRVGDIQGMLEEQDKAKQAYQQAIALFETLVDQFPDKPEDAADLADSHYEMGVVLQKRGEFEQATGAFRKALAIQQPLARDHPAVAQYRLALASCTNCLAVVQRSNSEKEKILQRALALYDELPQDARNSRDWRDGFSLTLANLGILLFEMDRHQDAEEALRQAVEIKEKLAAEFPDVHSLRHGTDKYYMELALVLAETGRIQESEQAFRRGIDIQRKLANQFPNVVAYQKRLALGHRAFGARLFAAGRHREALEQHRKALEQFRITLQLSPDNGEAHRLLAWFLATCPDSQFRDPATAVELATEAIQKTPEKGFFWKTLGMAQYRAGNWEAARQALQKGMELRSRAGSVDFFFLAMIHWQLADRDTARRWYDKALEWIDHMPRYEANQRLHAEAAELLGRAAVAPEPDTLPPKTVDQNE